jgi:hypothetical protein
VTALSGSFGYPSIDLKEAGRIVVHGEFFQQVRQFAQHRSIARFQRSLNRMRGTLSDLLYLFFL